MYIGYRWCNFSRPDLTPYKGPTCSELFSDILGPPIPSLRVGGSYKRHRTFKRNTDQNVFSLFSSSLLSKSFNNYH